MVEKVDVSASTSDDIQAERVNIKRKPPGSDCEYYIEVPDRLFWA